MNASLQIEIRSRFSDYLRALSTALHAHGLKLSQCVGSYPKPDQRTAEIATFYDPQVVGETNDVVRVRNCEWLMFIWSAGTVADRALLPMRRRHVLRGGA